jgi:fucose permease
MEKYMVALLLLVIIYLSFISLGLPDSLLGSAWPAMYYSLNVPIHYAGFISMITAGGTVVSSLFSEKIIRHFGTGIVTSISVTMTAFALVGFSFSHLFLALCFCAILLGLGAGSIDVSLNNYVALHYKARHMSWLHCFWGIGASSGPMIMSAFLIHKNSWQWGYRVIGMIQLGIAVILFISLPLWKNKKEPERTIKHKPVKFIKLFGITGVKEVLIAFFCYCTIEAVIFLWGSSYLVSVKNIMPEIAARWIAFYYFGMTSGRFLSGFITIKLNNRQMIRLGQGIIGCGVIILVLPFGSSTLLPGLFMIGLGCAPIFPSIIHATPKNFGEEYSAAVIGLQMTSAYIGFTSMPPLFGLIASNMGFSVFPIFIGIVLILNITMIETSNRKIGTEKNEKRNTNQSR